MKPNRLILIALFLFTITGFAGCGGRYNPPQENLQRVVAHPSDRIGIWRDCLRLGDCEYWWGLRWTWFMPGVAYYVDANYFHIWENSSWVDCIETGSGVLEGVAFSSLTAYEFANLSPNPREVQPPTEDMPFYVVTISDLRRTYGGDFIEIRLFYRDFSFGSIRFTGLLYPDEWEQEQGQRLMDIIHSMEVVNPPRIVSIGVMGTFALLAVVIVVLACIKNRRKPEPPSIHPELDEREDLWRNL